MVYSRRQKIQLGGKQFRMALPLKWVKNKGLQKGDAILVLTEDMNYGNVLVVVSERVYNTSPYLREKIAEFLKEEVI